MIDLNTILLALIALAGTYLGVKQKGQHALAVIHAEKVNQQEITKAEHTAALTAHTATMAEVVRVISAQNISNHVMSETIGQLITTHEATSESNSKLRKDVHTQSGEITKFTDEVKRGMEETHRRIDGALERRIEPR